MLRYEDGEKPFFFPGKLRHLNMAELINPAGEKLHGKFITKNGKVGRFHSSALPFAIEDWHRYGPHVPGLSRAESRGGFPYRDKKIILRKLPRNFEV